MIPVLLGIGLTLLSNVVCCADPHYWQYIVIGAGPGGLQMGYFLERANRDYIILEKANTSGSFFDSYPRHDKLISINKRYTGKTNKEFNFRHDWNSLISDDESLLFGQYSKDFFPHRSTMKQYLINYEKKLGLNVWHNKEISNIRRIKKGKSNEGIFLMEDQDGNTYSCGTLIVATGMWKPNVPSYKGMELAEGYETVSTDPKDFLGKNVLILGHGNAAFETADAIYGHANMVHVAGRSRVRLAWETHYVGDLRGLNNGLLDTYQLKSLDGVVEGHLHEVEFKQEKNGRIRLILPTTISDNFALRESYDSVIRCMGFTFDESIFNDTSKPLKGVGKSAKYPMIGFDYQVVNFQGMYVAGAASHSLDFRKSAGGFIHGFRYTAQSLHRLLEWQNHGEPWPSVKLDLNDLLNTVVKRMNEASGIYQMFGILADIITISRDGDLEYFEEYPLHLLHEFPNRTGRPVDRVIVMVLQYGQNYSGPGKDVFRESRATGFASSAHKSNFLHPVFYYYTTLPTEADMDDRPTDWILPVPERIHHVVEDFLTQWMGPKTHILPLRKFLEYCLQKDLRNFYADTCFEMALTHRTSPHMCSQYYLSGHGLTASLEPEYDNMPTASS